MRDILILVALVLGASACTETTEVTSVPAAEAPPVTTAPIETVEPEEVEEVEPTPATEAATTEPSPTQVATVAPEPTPAPAEAEPTEGPPDTEPTAVVESETETESAAEPPAVEPSPDESANPDENDEDDTVLGETETPEAEEAEPPADDVSPLPAVRVMEMSQFGGCTPIGLCENYVVFTDGRVEAKFVDGGVLNTGAVDIALVNAVVDASDIDRDAFVATLPPAESCSAFVDGVDDRFIVDPLALEISTCDANIYDSNEPLLVAMVKLINAARAAAPIN